MSFIEEELDVVEEFLFENEKEVINEFLKETFKTDNFENSEIFRNLSFEENLHSYAEKGGLLR